jgi:hypothetical protein
MINSSLSIGAIITTPSEMTLLITNLWMMRANQTLYGFKIH